MRWVDMFQEALSEGSWASVSQRLTNKFKQVYTIDMNELVQVELQALRCHRVKFLVEEDRRRIIAIDGWPNISALQMLNHTRDIWMVFALKLCCWHAWKDQTSKHVGIWVQTSIDILPKKRNSFQQVNQASGNPMIYWANYPWWCHGSSRQQVRLWWEMRSAVLDQMVEEASGGIEARRRPGQISVSVMWLKQ